MTLCMQKGLEGEGADGLGWGLHSGTPAVHTKRSHRLTRAPNVRTALAKWCGRSYSTGTRAKPQVWCIHSTGDRHRESSRGSGIPPKGLKVAGSSPGSDTDGGTRAQSCARVSAGGPQKWDHHCLALPPGACTAPPPHHRSSTRSGAQAIEQQQPHADVHCALAAPGRGDGPVEAALRNGAQGVFQPRARSPCAQPHAPSSMAPPYDPPVGHPHEEPDPQTGLRARLWGGGGPANPVATGCQGNPCSTGIRWGVSPAAQMGCLRNRSGSPSGADQP